jgi:hypothetical protein
MRPGPARGAAIGPALIIVTGIFILAPAARAQSGDPVFLNKRVVELYRAGKYTDAISHWEVASDSTVKLITKAVSELKANPRIGRAEALRRSMLSLIATGKDYEAHPAFWAPFVLVGEGAR